MNRRDLLLYGAASLVLARSSQVDWRQSPPDLVADTDGLRRWLLDHDPDEIVGDQYDAEHCLVAQYFRSRGYHDVWWQRRDGMVGGAHVKACIEIGQTVGRLFGHGNVTAKQALHALDWSITEWAFIHAPFVLSQPRNT